jgi:ribokinase
MSVPLLRSLGSVNLDVHMRVERRPEPSETLLGSNFLRADGGKSANRALITRRPGAPASLLARLGRDEMAEAALAPLRQPGIDLSGDRRPPGRATGVSMITVPPDGRKGIVLAANANRDWEADAAEIMRAAVEKVPDGSALALDAELPEAVALAAARADRERGLAVLLDPSSAGDVSVRLPLATVATPNGGKRRCCANRLTAGFPLSPSDVGRRAA